MLNILSEHSFKTKKTNKKILIAKGEPYKKTKKTGQNEHCKSY